MADHPSLRNSAKKAGADEESKNDTQMDQEEQPDFPTAAKTYEDLVKAWRKGEYTASGDPLVLSIYRDKEQKVLVALKFRAHMAKQEM